MLSTRKQKAKERQSRQLDILSDVENGDVMLGIYSRNDDRNGQSENELNLDSESSRPQRSSNVTGEDLRSLLTNSRENSEITIETTRMIIEEISNQISRRLNEIKASLIFKYKTQFQQQLLIQYFSLIKIRWNCRGELISMWWTEGLPGHILVQGRKIPPWRTKGPVGFNGTPKEKMPRKRGKIVPKGVLHKNIVDKCLGIVQ